MPDLPQFKSLSLSLEGAVLQLAINRPAKRNALNADFWRELPEAMRVVEREKSIRVAILRGQGEHFSAGMDLGVLMQLATLMGQDAADNAEALQGYIKNLQNAINSVENCRKPVIAAISGCCLGAALELACVCDLRYASLDAYFAIREIDLALVADLGALHRLPRLIGDGMTRELAYTGRNFSAQEALSYGLLQRRFESANDLHSSVLDIARQIAEKSPRAVRGSKQVLNHARDHSLESGLDYAATLNAATLQGKDPLVAMRAFVSKQKVSFAD